uniref:protein-tyrosine-phosphatase n=1 Tax=Strigamia maritima TaxID=126957 RepID=T1IVH8_STRMM
MAYIASQGPLPSTVDDFWRMIWECEIQVIIMSCNEIESGKRKCDKYWADKGEEKTFANVKVKFVRIKQVCAEFVVRTMTAINGNQERTIVQFHYISWPDHGIPDSVKPILKMVKLVRGCQASETLPVLVHCSAGCGRTGTICAIDFVWGLLRTGKLTDDFSLFQLVSNMRKQRIAMVQTKEQYILVYRAVKELFEEHLRVMDSHLYENVDLAGTPLLLSETDCDFIDEEDDNKNSIKKSTSGLNEDAATRELIKPDTGNSTDDLQAGSVQHLISTWNSTSTENESDSKTTSPSEHHYENISLYSTSTASLATSPTESDLQPEKVVIVHKPSIARLRAIFEKNPAVENTAPKNADENVEEQRRSKGRKKNNVGEKRKPSKRGDKTTGLRYRDTALTVYSELRHSRDGIEIAANIEIQLPIVPETPDFIRRDKPKRSSLRRSSSSVWYDEEAQSKCEESEKPALPVKRSKSLKVFKQPSKASSNSLEVPVNGHEKESNQEVEDSTLPKGVIKLKSSPWNPRRSQSMNSSKSKEVKAKPWYLFNEKEPNVVAGLDKAGIQLVQVKINADDKQLVFSEENGSFANTDKQQSATPVEEINSFIVKAKEIEFTIHEPAVEKKLWVPKVEKIKREPQRARVEMRMNSCQEDAIDEDKPPPLPVKMYSPCNSPRLCHQDARSRNFKSEEQIRELEKSSLERKTNVTKEIMKNVDDKEVQKDAVDKKCPEFEKSDKIIKSPEVGITNLSSAIAKNETPSKSEEKDIDILEITDTKSRSDDDDKSLETEAEESNYQQIIKDCQEYLISSGYINAVPKMYQNLTSIEKNPRSGFVDLSSTVENEVSDPNDGKCDTIKNILSQSKIESSPIPDEFYMAEDVQEIMREIEADGESSRTSKKQYEHLWLSRSGKLDNKEPADYDSDLHSYKIVQQVLNSRKEREKCVEQVSITENEKKNLKCKKPKPLPRNIVPPPKPNLVEESCDITGCVDFSSEDEDEDGDEDRKSDSGSADAQPICIYSEVLKEKPKITYQFRPHLGSKDDLYLLPSAPPRLKRQFSLHKPKTTRVDANNLHKWRHTLPGRTPANMKKVKLKSEKRVRLR